MNGMVHAQRRCMATVAACGLLILAGCGTDGSGPSVPAGLQRVASSIGGGAGFAPAPPDDGSACHASERVAFYAAAQAAYQADRRRQGLGIMEAAARNRFGARIIDGVGGAGTAATMRSVSGALRGVLDGVQDDRRLIAEVTSTFQALAACRRREGDAIRADVRAGRLGRADGQRRLNEIRETLATDAGVARQANAAVAARNRGFEQAVASADADLARDPGRAAEGRAEARQVRAEIQTNQRALDEQLSSVDRAVTTGWSL